MKFRKIITLAILGISICFGGLISPENGANLNHIHVLFEWEQVPEAVHYELQISENSNFSDIVVQVDDNTLIYVEKEALDWDKTYYWRIRPLYDTGPTGSWSDSFSFSTGSPLSETTTTISNANQIQDGVTVFGAFFNYFSAAVDETGKEIWNSGDENLVYYSTDDFGNVFGCTLVSGAENNLPGKEFTFDGETIWEEPNDEFLHHDIIQLPNGNYLGIVETSSLGPIPIGSWTPLFQSLGFIADGVTVEFPWIGDKIVEWDVESGNVVWEWNVFDHYNMVDYDQYGGTWNQAYLDLHYDWTHVNAVIFDEEDSAIYISTRHLSRLTKIDYPSGDVIWNMGHEMPSGDVTMGHDIGFSFQHSIQILDNGNFLTFDNGNLSEIFRGTNDPQSRAIEISVNGNNAELAWSYELPDDLFGFASGNAQKLANGNVIVTTVGGGGRSLEVNSSGMIVWEANYNLSLPNGAVYRAHRIPGLFPAAYSVMVNDLHEIYNEPGVYLTPVISSISYDVINEGNYELELHYTFTDQLGWFEPTEGNLIIQPNSTETLSFTGDIPETNNMSNIELVVTPVHHPERQKLVQVNGHSYSLGNKPGTLPTSFQLYDPFPNPFNPSITIPIEVSGDQKQLILEVYDISGRMVKEFVNGYPNTGHHQFYWDARNQTSGIYFVKLTNGHLSQSKKIVLLK